MAASAEWRRALRRAEPALRRAGLSDAQAHTLLEREGFDFDKEADIYAALETLADTYWRMGQIIGAGVPLTPQEFDARSSLAGSALAGMPARVVEHFMGPHVDAASVFAAFRELPASIDEARERLMDVYVGDMTRLQQQRGFTEERPELPAEPRDPTAYLRRGQHRPGVPYASVVRGVLQAPGTRAPGSAGRIARQEEAAYEARRVAEYERAQRKEVPAGYTPAEWGRERARRKKTPK